jgi:nucleoside 2-deoxyribosyltransferase
MTTRRIYVASPLGFSEVGRLFMHDRLLPLVNSLGFAVEDPWELTSWEEVGAVQEIRDGAERIEAWRCLNTIIGERNAKAIARSDAMIAVLDGVDVDSGTASEIGYAYAKGLRIIGYRGDFRLSADNEGAVVNLQVEHFIRASGGTIVTTVTALEPELKNILEIT